jgi:hypothetical protein
MQMHFHIPDAEPHYLRDAVEQIAPVLFLRVEKAVLGALICGIPWSGVGNARPLLTPLRDAAKRGFNGCAHAQRFVVIGNGNPGTLRLCEPRAFSKAVYQIRQKPNLCVSRKLHEMDFPLVRIGSCRGDAAIKATC